MTPSTVQIYQEKTLRELAEREHRYRDLIIFYLVLGNTEAIRELARDIPRDSPDQLYVRLAFLFERPEEAAQILTEAQPIGDTWLFYSLTKHFLNNEQVEHAIRAVTISLQHAPGNVTALNLLVKYFSNHGDRQMVDRLARKSLELCPQQEDISTLLEGKAFGDLYLTTAPRKVPISFYVPVYNVERYIRMALEGIFSLNYPLEEVIVVDDGTPDNSIEIALTFPVTVARHPVNQGLAAARNTAIRHCRTPLIGSIDTDARPASDYVLWAITELENGPQGLAGIGGRLIENRQDTPADRWRALAMPQHWGDRRICSPEFLFGSNGVYSREALMHVGGYDEQFRTNAEDTHICQALRAAGFRLVYLPWAKVYHERTDSIPSVVKTVWNWYFSMKTEQGVYRDLQRLNELMRLTIEHGANMLEQLYRNGLHDLLYVQFAYITHELLRDMLYVVSQGKLSSKTFDATVSGLFDCIAHLDSRYGDSLCLKLQRDLADVLTCAPQEQAGEIFCDIIQTVVSEFMQFCNTISKDVYESMTLST